MRPNPAIQTNYCHTFLATGEDTYTGGNGFEGIENRKLDPSDIV